METLKSIATKKLLSMLPDLSRLPLDCLQHVFHTRQSLTPNYSTGDFVYVVAGRILLNHEKAQRLSIESNEPIIPIGLGCASKKHIFVHSVDPGVLIPFGSKFRFRNHMRAYKKNNAFFSAFAREDSFNKGFCRSYKWVLEEENEEYVPMILRDKDRTYDIL
jgi:hypothetical protein